MSPPPVAARGLLRPHPVVAVVAFAKLALLLTCASAYGYSKDELYSIALTRHLAWGVVDRAPLSIAVLAFVQKLYGETLLSLRIVPAVVGALTVVVTARLARRFGAETRGQVLAALSVAVAPELLANDHVYSIASLDVLLWAVIAGLFARAVTASPGAAGLPWFRAGVLLGLGCLNDLTAAAFGLALLVGLAGTPQRVWLRRTGPWLALGVALAFLAPYVSWERANGWPTRELLANEAHRAVATGPLAFAWRQLLMMLPANAIVWGLGLFALLRSERLATYRLFGVAFVALFVLFAATGNVRAGSLAPAYPVVLAAGAATLEPWLAARRGTYPALALVLAATGALAAPFAIPMLRVAKFESYARAVPLGSLLDDARDARSAPGALPRRFAAMYGWPELTRAVASVVEALPPEDRADAVVLASNYGEAGALELFGGAVGLPLVISGHDQYWLWGTAGASGRVVIAVGGDEALLRSSFRTVEVATVFGHSLALPSEQRARVYLCRDSIAPLEVLWPRFKVYD